MTLDLLVVVTTSGSCGYFMKIFILWFHFSKKNQTRKANEHIW